MRHIREGYVGPYRIIQRLPALHEDDLVEAWLAELPDGPEQVVLNILRIPHRDLNEECQRAYNSFQNEVGILKRARHLNIVRIYPLHPKAISRRGERYLSQADFEGESWGFWAMEHLQGGSLASRMEQIGRLGLEEAAEVVYQVGAALDYIHSKGIVHLNVHPHNIFFRYPLSRSDLSMELVLADFGTAARADQEVVDERIAAQFKPYVAPERIRPPKTSPDQPLDNRPMDVFSLGALFYHMLAGSPPFAGTDGDVERAILEVNPPALQRFDVPVEIEDLIFQSLQKDPAKRPSMEHLLISLDKSVPPPREIGPRIPVRKGAAAEGAPGGVEGVSPPAPSFFQRLRNRLSRTPPAPRLLEPADGAVLEGRVVFAWDWKERLKDNEAFELRIWKEARHDRAGELQREPESEIDLDTLVPELPGEEDECFWSVAVVQESPYLTLSKEAKPRSFTYGEQPPEREMEEKIVNVQAWEED